MEKGSTIFSKILTREATEVVGRVWALGSNLYYAAFCENSLNSLVPVSSYLKYA